MSKSRAVLVVHEAVPPEIPGLTESVQMLADANEKFADAAGRFGLANDSLLELQAVRDKMTAKIVAAEEIVESSAVAVAEGNVRNAEGFTMLMRRAVEAAEARVANATAALHRVLAVESGRRIDALRVVNGRAVTALKAAHADVERTARDVAHAEYMRTQAPEPAYATELAACWARLGYSYE